MKKLRNIYLIAGLAALVFALMAKHIPGITITDFVYGFCLGLSLTLLVAGLVTAGIPLFCTKKEEEDASASEASNNRNTTH